MRGKRVILVNRSIDIKKEMFRLFIEGDFEPYANKIFLFKEKMELNYRKDINLKFK